MSKVTVLMPVYNAEKYLRRSLDSLLRQTFSNIQIVCVDDGSTDSSLSLLNYYAGIDARIKVLHLGSNHGQAYARNIGLKRATGEYIGMLDADDWLADDAIEQAMKVFDKFPKTDCVLLDVREISDDGVEKSYSWHYDKDKHKSNPDGSFVMMSGYEAFMESLDWGIHGVTIDRATLYEKFPYDASSRFYSDDNTARLHFLASREVRCCKGIYFYFQHQASVSHHIGVGHMDWILAADSFRSTIEKMGMAQDVLSIWEYERWKIIVGCYWFCFVHVREMSVEELQYSLTIIRQAWQSVKLERLSGKQIKKFGWYPFPGHWHLFQLEEMLYFILRRLVGRR